MSWSNNDIVRIVLFAIVCMIVCFALQSNALAARSQGSQIGTKAPVNLQKLDEIMQSEVGDEPIT